MGHDAHTPRRQPAPCPLCLAVDTRPYHQDRTRVYLQCPRCALVFVPSDQHVSEDAERAEYDLHENDPTDAGYRRFLSRLVTPMQARLAAGSQGLDFGSGPGPTLSLMFAESGFPTALYDKFYQPDTQVLNRAYDFVTATEVVEHLREPRIDLARMWDCVKPGGLLGVMTKLTRDRDAFATWHYIRDPTHVCFYGRATFSWLARAWRADLSVVASDALILGKPGG